MLHRALKMLRVYHQMTQEHVASLIGITKSYVSEIEAGNKKPSFEIIEKYAEVFEIPLSSLIFFAENIESNINLNKARGAIAGKVLSILDFIAHQGGLRGAQKD